MTISQSARAAILEVQVEAALAGHDKRILKTRWHEEGHTQRGYSRQAWNMTNQELKDSILEAQVNDAPVGHISAPLISVVEAGSPARR